MPQTLLSTSELIIQIRAKSSIGAEVLYDQYARLLRFAIFRIVKQQVLADGILEETISKIWDTAGLYNEQEKPFLAWVLNIAKTEALKQLIVIKLELNDQAGLKLKLA